MTYICCLQNRLDDVFDAFTMLTNGGFVSLMPVDAVCINSQLSRDIETDPRARSTQDYLTRMAAEYVRYINVKGISKG